MKEGQLVVRTAVTPNNTARRIPIKQQYVKNPSVIDSDRQLHRQVHLGLGQSFALA